MGARREPEWRGRRTRWPRDPASWLHAPGSAAPSKELVSHLGKREREVIFHFPPPGDSEESKIHSQLVLLLLSFLLLSSTD